MTGRFGLNLETMWQEYFLGGFDRRRRAKAVQRQCKASAKAGARRQTTVANPNFAAVGFCGTLLSKNWRHAHAKSDCGRADDQRHW